MDCVTSTQRAPRASQGTCADFHPTQAEVSIGLTPQSYFIYWPWLTKHGTEISVAQLIKAVQLLVTICWDAQKKDFFLYFLSVMDTLQQALAAAGFEVTGTLVINCF